MKLYTVIKDFPSRNGVTQYKVGETIRVDENSRTIGLVRLGYIKEQTKNLNLDREIMQAIAKIDGVKNATAVSYHARGNKKWLTLGVEVEK